MAKEVTNYQPGPRGINLDNGTTVWLQPGESLTLDKSKGKDGEDVYSLGDLTVKGALPNFGKPADQADRDASEVETLRERVATLEAENGSLRAALEAGKVAQEPGPLDGSIDELTKHLEGVSDVDEVQRLIDAENGGKSRAGAIKALEARRDELLA